jgi:hypothetical protein
MSCEFVDTHREKVELLPAIRNSPPLRLTSRLIGWYLVEGFLVKRGQWLELLEDSWSKLEEGVEYVSRWIRQALMALSVQCSVGWMREIDRWLSVLTHTMLDNPPEVLFGFDSMVDRKSYRVRDELNMGMLLTIQYRSSSKSKCLLKDATSVAAWDHNQQMNSVYRTISIVHLDRLHSIYRYVS